MKEDEIILKDHLSEFISPQRSSYNESNEDKEYGIFLAHNLAKRRNTFGTHYYGFLQGIAGKAFIAKIFKIVGKFSHVVSCLDLNVDKSWSLVNEDMSTFLQIRTEPENKNGFYVSYTARSTNRDQMRELRELGIKYLKQKKKSFTVHLLGKSSQGLCLKEMGFMKQPIIRENYTDKVLEDYDYIVRQFSSKVPDGRLAILDGPPGTGKSFLLKSFVGEVKNVVTIFLPVRFIAELDGPGIVDLMIAERERYKEEDNPPSLLLILEDADMCLVSRGMGANDSVISSLLNFTDGFFGDLLDIKILATTNASRIQFDDAIMRPGRMCRNVSVGKLSADKAEKVYHRLTFGGPFGYDKDVTLAEIYADSKGVDVKRKPAGKRVGFGVVPTSNKPN